MKRALIVWAAAVIAAAVLLTGCQATPDEPVVVQKDMEQMIEKGMAESMASQTEAPLQTQSPAPTTYAELCSAYGVPERFKTSITEGNLTVSCDAVIELPETATLPMASVEAGRFSQDQVYVFFKALCGDTPMYVPPEQANKEYYEKQILEYQRLLTTEKSEESIDFYRDRIEEMQKEYEKAPEKIELVRADGTLETKEFNYDTDTISGKSTYTMATSEPFGENATSFYVHNDAEYENAGLYSFKDEQGNTQMIAPVSWSRLWFDREGANTAYGPGMEGRKLSDVTQLSLSGGAADNCMLSMTPQQARKTVEELLKQTGTKDMVIDAVSLYSNKQLIPTEVIERMKQEGGYKEDTRPETQAYVFRLLRQVDGVKVESNSRSSSQTNEQGMDFGKEWYYEMLSIAVDDKGIANLYWEAPLVVTEIMTQDTAIRPWSEIEDIFGKMMLVQYANDIKADGRTTVINIARATLTLRRITQRDSFTQGLLVPAWSFFGTTASQSGGEDAHTVDCEDYPFLTVNAIDGSVIDINKGY